MYSILILYARTSTTGPTNNKNNNTNNIKLITHKTQDFRANYLRIS